MKNPHIFKKFISQQAVRDLLRYTLTQSDKKHQTLFSLLYYCLLMINDPAC